MPFLCAVPFNVGSAPADISSWALGFSLGCPVLCLSWKVNIFPSLSKNKSCIGNSATSSKLILTFLFNFYTGDFFFFFGQHLPPSTSSRKINVSIRRQFHSKISFKAHIHILYDNGPWGKTLSWSATMLGRNQVIKCRTQTPKGDIPFTFLKR